MNHIINNLNGYLYSLRRFTGNKCDFWTELVELEGSLEDSVKNHLSTFEVDLEITDSKNISYSEVEALLDSFILSNLKIDDDDIKKLLAWDIVEYYGLASTDIDEKNDFNPLVSNGAIQFTMKSDFHSSHIYYAVPIGNQIILTGLAVRGA